MVFDKDWHLEQFNSSAQKILGYSLVNYLECSIENIPIISEKKINFGDSFKQNNEINKGLTPSGKMVANLAL